MPSDYPATAAQTRSSTEGFGNTAHTVQMLPFRFSGRVRYVLDSNAAAQVLEAALRRASQPERLMPTEVERYCDARNIVEPRMQLAILREAFRVVSREVLIERMIHAASRQLDTSMTDETPVERLHERPQVARGRILADNFHGSLYREDRSLILRLALGTTIEPPLTLRSGQTIRARASQEIALGGLLKLEGKLETLQGTGVPAHLRMHWRVQPGADSVNTAAIESRTSLPTPLPTILACIGAGALARFGEVLPLHLAALTGTDRGPAFVRFERLLRLGRVTEKTRAYELFWQRLRDYLIWRVSDDLKS